MKIEITQIGDVPLRGIFQDRHDYEQQITARQDSEGLLGDAALVMPQNEYGYKPIEITIEGTIAERPGDVVESTIARLKRYASTAVPVFGVIPLDRGDYTHALWIRTMAFVNDFNREPDDAGGADISIELQINGMFAPINRLLWEYSDRHESAIDLPTTPTTPSPSLLGRFPTWEEYVADRQGYNYYRWVRKPENATLMLDPAFWSLPLSGLPSGFPSIGEHVPWNDVPDVQTIWTDAALFNGRPMVCWALRKLETAYNVTLTFWRSATSGGTETVAIDTDALNTLLTSKTGTGLQETDILLIGDVEGRAVVLRDGVVVAYCSSILGQYKGVVPGYIPIGEHMDYRVNFSPAATAEWSNLILWRLVG
ncbi:MAG: hypothetical protein KC496_17920 [Anaerolineae bacterium]|nr:hypothetical protein [Anaerolineae bacterium]